MLLGYICFAMCFCSHHNVSPCIGTEATGPTKGVLNPLKLWARENFSLHMLTTLVLVIVTESWLTCESRSKFLRSWHTVYHNDYPVFLSHQPCMGSSFSHSVVNICPHLHEPLKKGTRHTHNCVGPWFWFTVLQYWYVKYFLLCFLVTNISTLEFLE